MMHGWQSESTDEPKGGCFFLMVAAVTSPTTAGCSADVIVLVASCGCICSCAAM